MALLSVNRLGSLLWTVVGRSVPQRHFCQHCRTCSPHMFFMYMRQPYPYVYLRNVTTVSNSTNTNIHRKSDSRSGNRTQENKLSHEKVKNKKLHNRVFSEKEQAEIEQLIQITLANKSDEDRFGTLNRIDELEDNSQSPAWNPAEIGGIEKDQKVQKLAKPNLKKNHQFHSERSEASNWGRTPNTDNWNDRFGTLQEDDLEERIQESLTTTVGSHEERFSDDESTDAPEHVRLSKFNRRRIPDWYGRKILKLGKQGKIREAIEVFDDWMLKQDRVLPNSFVFTCIITILGRAGYTKKAFSLFNKMKKMGIQPKPATYTALFNACANSPWKEDGRTRAEKLYDLMKQKEVEPTLITGKAMIKAFAMCGDLRRAFSLVDELSNTHRPDPEMFSFLLAACISDSFEGLRHAIQVWRLMLQMRVRPDLPLYNLLIRCIRDCGVGDVKSFHTLLAAGSVLPSSDSSHNTSMMEQSSISEEELAHVSDSKTFYNSKSSAGVLALNHLENTSQVESMTREPILSAEANLSKLPDDEDVSSSLTVSSTSATTYIDLSRLISQTDLSTKEHRMALLGGVKGILSQMAKDKAKPDIITFTQLFSVAMPTEEEENSLLAAMQSMNVHPDIDLVNTLIHKRCMRKDFAVARAAKQLILTHQLTANQRTYGVLAMTCKTQKEAEELLEDMEANKLAPNIEILGTLMYAASMNFHYKLWILQQVKKLDLEPNAKFLQNVEKELAFVRRIITNAEKKDDRVHFCLSSSFQKSLEKFSQYYEDWLKETKIPAPRHPWTAFRPLEKEAEDQVSAETVRTVIKCLK